MAIGNGATGTLNNSVALGLNSVTDYSSSDLSQPGWAPGNAVTLPSSDGAGVISVGRTTEARRISNVAGGYRDTDAVNVSQLKAAFEAVNTEIELINKNKGINFLSVNKKVNYPFDPNNVSDTKTTLEAVIMKSEKYDDYANLLRVKKIVDARKARGEKINPTFLSKLNTAINDAQAGGNQQDFERVAKALLDVDIAKNAGSLDEVINKIEEKYQEIMTDSNKDKLVVDLKNGDTLSSLLKKSNHDNGNATGAGSVAIGVFAEAAGDFYSTAVGAGAKATANSAVAIGNNAEAKSNNTLAVGKQAIANGVDSVALGIFSTAGVENSETVTTGENSNRNTYVQGVAVGVGVKATGKRAVALGTLIGNQSLNKASDDQRTTASGERSLALGAGTKSAATDGISIGTEAKVDSSATNGIAIGLETKVTAANGIAIGAKNTDVSSNIIATTAGEKAVALGYGARALRTNGVAIGTEATVDINEGSPTAGVAIGYKSNVTGTKPSVAIGRFAKAGAGEGFYYGGTNKPTEDKASAIIAPTEGEFAIGDVSGSNTYTRRITGLAAGKDLTDAVNVSQLKALGDTGLKFGANLPNNTAKTPNPITAKIGKQIDIKGAEIDINKDNIITNISKDNQDNLTISIATKPDLIANSIGRTLDTGANAEGNRLRFLADDKFTLGKGVEATAANSFAIGFGSKALQQNAIALGNGAEAGLKSGSDDNQIAIGTTSKATGHSAISIGNMWQNDSNKAIDGATGEYSVAIGGEHTRASGAGALAFGRSAQATGAQSIAIGSKINKDDTTQSTASNVNAIAIGSGSDASGENSIALGSKEDIQESTGSRNRAQKTSAKGANSLALGRAAVAEGENSIAIGRKAKTEGAIGTSKAPANQIAIGTSAYTNGEEAISIGTVSQGSDTGARAKRAISLGNGDIKANGERAVAIGSDTQALGQGAVAIGGGEHDKAGAKIKNIIANAENTIAIGTAAQAMSGNAIAIGTRSSVNISNGPTAGVAIGLDTIVEGDKPSVAIGRYSKASVTGEAEQGYYLDGKVPVATTSASEGEVKKTNAIHTPTAGVFAIGDIDRNNEPVTRRITGLAAGKADTDAVNVSQLKGMENAGLKLAADIPGVKSNQALTAKLGRQVNIVSGDLDGANSTFKGVNLKTNISQDNQGNVTTITVALDKDLTSDSIGRSKDGNGIVNQGNRLRFVDDNKFTLGKGVEVSSVANDKVIAIGFTEGNTAVAAKGNKSVAIGFGVQSTGLNSIAIGSGKTIATGSGSIAIGNNAIVKQDNSVALGSDSETAGVSGAGKYFGLDSSKAESGIVMEPNHGEIAIGSSTKTRRLTGLSAGKNKTDAVNVYQLESLANNTIKISADNTAISDGNTENAISKKLSEGLNIVIKGAKNSGLSTKIKGDAIEIELAKAETIKDPLPKDSGKPEEGPSDEKFTTEKAVAEYVKSKTDNLNPNIAIRANGKNANKQENEKNDISLKDGLNFIDGDNTVATITDTSDVKFDLKPALTGITSISGNTKGKAILTFKEDGNMSTSGKLELNASGSIVDGDNNAVTGATVKSALTEVGNTDNSIKVDANTNANGKTTYTVSLKESYKNKLDSLAENPNATYITNENYKIGTGINEKEWEKKLEIAYKADGDKKADGGAIADKKTKLSDGFIFKGDNNIAITTDLGKDETGKGIIKYSLSNKLTGIQEISNGNGENGNTSIKIKDDKIEFGNRSIDNFKSGSIAEDSKEAVSGEAVYNHLKTNYASSGDLKTTLNSYLTRVDAGNTYVGKDSTISLTGNDGEKQL